MLNGWFYSDNLTTFVEMLAAVTGYDLHPDEIEAIRFGLTATDSEKGHWFDYTFTGTLRVSIRLASDPGSSVTHFEADGAGSIAKEIDLLSLILSTYRVTR